MVINKNGVMVRQLKPRPKALVFEYICPPDSIIDGLSVMKSGSSWGGNWPGNLREADVVVPVPDTGIAIALGFAEASGIPYDVGLYKNTYVGRTFIQPSREMRDLGVRIKLNPVEKVIRDRRVVIIDDTIVRGTTSANIIHLLREAGAREVHLCISAPPITHPCYYGIDTSVRKELIAASHTVDEIRRQIGVDTLTYLSVEGLKKALDTTADLHCFGCFGKGYPIPSAPEKKGEG